jgi:hypothetical protein
LTRLEDAAKQIIGLNTALQGLYFAVFAFSDLRKQVSAIHIPVLSNLILLLSFIPVLLWLISLYCATRVFVPQIRSGANINEMGVNAWQSIKQTYEKAVDDKMHWLHYSHCWLVISFATMLIVLLVFTFALPGSESGPTQIIIVTPTPMATPTPTP